MTQQTKLNQGRPSFLRRHTPSLVLLALVLALALLQSPMLKGTFYRLFGGKAPTDTIPWLTNLDAAMQEAKISNRPILVDFTASWCPPCQTMVREVWPSKQVSELTSDNFVPVKIDIDADQVTASQYNIVSIPAILVLSPNGEVLKRSGYLSRREMIAFLNSSVHEATQAAGHVGEQRDGG